MALLNRLVLKTAVIRQKREALGITQQEAAERAGFQGKQQWYGIESGKNDNVKVKTLRDIARVLGCKTSDLIDDEASARPAKRKGGAK